MNPECNFLKVKVLMDVIKKLTAHEVQFCHWKSNYHLAYALSGKEDWDVLISKTDFSKFLSVIAMFGAKQAVTTYDAYQAGVFHFYILDHDTGKLVHIHAYCQVLTGDSISKSFALPLEKLLLENTRIDSMPLPIKEAELIVYLFRNTIKHFSIIDLLLIARAKVDINEELLWLCDGLDSKKFRNLVDNYFTGVPIEALVEFLDTTKNSRSWYHRAKAARPLMKWLNEFRRISWFQSKIITVKTLTKIIVSKFFLKRKYKKLSNGGLIIALIGPQAVGKSTIAKHLHKWLGTDFDVRIAHVGKPRPIFLTLPFRLALPLMRRILPSLRSTEIEYRIENAKDANVQFSTLHIVRKIILGQERRTLLKKIYRNAANGTIYICDRYPSDQFGAVDGSSFSEDQIALQTSGLRQKLMKYERDLYQRVCPPNLVICLSVDLEEAINRDKERDKPGKKDSRYVAFRHTMKDQPKFTRSTTYKFDTGQPLQETIAAIRQKIWLHL